MNEHIDNNKQKITSKTAYIYSLIHPKGGYVAIPSEDKNDAENNATEIRMRSGGYVALPQK